MLRQNSPLVKHEILEIEQLNTDGVIVHDSNFVICLNPIHIV